MSVAIFAIFAIFASSMPLLSTAMVSLVVLALGATAVKKLIESR